MTSLKKGKIKKTLRPSERESITDFSQKFGSGISYEDKLRGKKAAGYVLAAIIIILLVCTGFFITDVLIRITEIPAAVQLNPEAFSKWISFLTIPG